MQFPARRSPAAGLPWFMTIFGRDSHAHQLQALPFAPELGRGDTAASWPAARVRVDDDFRDEEPGKILHEQRFGEMTAFEERPHSPYYGAADVDSALPDLARRVRALDRRPPTWCSSSSPRPGRALSWIDEYGDREQRRIY